MAEKYFMVTILKEKKLFANIYKTIDELKVEFDLVKDKYPTRLWGLIETEEEKFDVVVAEANNKLVVCLDPKRPILEDEKQFKKCIKKEIFPKDLNS